MCWEVLREKGWTVLLPPTAVTELRLLTRSDDVATRELALLAIAELDRWDIQAYPLTDLQETLAESFSGRLIAAGLLPTEEWSDGVILGEASAAGLPLLVTSDRHLVHIEVEALKLTFAEADLDFTLPIRPRDLSRILR